MTDDMPGALLPIGHLVNARRAVQRYVETGSQLDVGTVLDELDELRRLVLDVAGALDSLGADARGTRSRPALRAVEPTAAAAALLRTAANNELQPAIHGLMTATRPRVA